MIYVRTWREAKRIRAALNTLGFSPNVMHYDTGGYRLDAESFGSYDEMALEKYLHDGRRADRVTFEALDEYR